MDIQSAVKIAQDASKEYKDQLAAIMAEVRRYRKKKAACKRARDKEGWIAAIHRENELLTERNKVRSEWNKKYPLVAIPRECLEQ